MGTVIETTSVRMSKNLAGTTPGLVALATVARLRPNVAVVVSLSGSATPYKSRRVRTGQDARAEVQRG